MLAYPFFEAHDLLGDRQYLRVALDLANSQKHDGIQRFTRDNGGPGDAPHFLAAWRQGGREALRAKFSGSVKLSPEEYERARLSAAKWLASQRDATRSPAQFLMKLRTAQGRFTPEQLAAGAPPHLCGTGLHSFKVVNWFDILWRQHE